MKLENWLAELRDQRLSEKEKTQIYSRILDKTHTGVLTKRISFYAKAWVFTLALFWAAIFFLSSTPSTRIVTNPDSPIATITRPLNAVQADTVGELIKVDWWITIFDWDKEISGEILTYGNTVLLQEDARVEVVVRQWVKATITWPAEFALERFVDESWNNAVVLNLIEGSYFEIVNVKISQEELDDATTDPEETLETIIVKTNNFEIQQMPAQRDMRVTITSEDWVQTVKNEGGDIIVKTLGNDNEWTLTVVWQDQIAVSDPVLVLADNKPEAIEKELTDKQLTIRYEIEKPLVINNVPVAEEDQETIADDGLETVTIQPKKPTTILDNRRVLDQELLTWIEGSLSLWFVSKHAGDITIYREAGDTVWAERSLAVVQWLVNRARGVAGLSPVDASFSWVIWWVQSLKTYLEANYFVPPSLISTLQSIVAVLEKAQATPLGTVVENE